MSFLRFLARPSFVMQRWPPRQVASAAAKAMAPPPVARVAPGSMRMSSTPRAHRVSSDGPVRPRRERKATGETLTQGRAGLGSVWLGDRARMARVPSCESWSLWSPKGGVASCLLVRCQSSSPPSSGASLAQETLGNVAERPLGRQQQACCEPAPKSCQGDETH